MWKNGQFPGEMDYFSGGENGFFPGEIVISRCKWILFRVGIDHLPGEMYNSPGEMVNVRVKMEHFPDEN